MSFHPGVYRYKPVQWLSKEELYYFRIGRLLFGDRPKVVLMYAQGRQK